MANTTIQLKKSATPAASPSNLANGELAINYADGKLFYKAANGTILAISGSGGATSNSFSTVNANGTLIVSDSPTNILTVVPGSGIAIVGDAINDKITISSTGTSSDKTYTFYQNTAPSTSNAHDLWVHSDTGFVYENFGNTTNPIWAEFGPSSVIGNTAIGSGSFIDLNVSGNTVLQKQAVVYYYPPTATNAAVHVVGANTQGGTGYFDFIRITNTSASSNTNKFFRVNPTGKFEIVNSAYSQTIFILEDNGSLTTGGSITPGSYTPGQVIKDTMLSNSEVTISTTTVATSTSDTDFMSYSYTPVSSSSYLIIHVHVASYEAAKTGGSGTDSYFSRIKVDGNEITYGSQYTRDTYTFRTGTLFPLIGRYTNSNTAAKSITVGVRRDSADDSINITNSATALWLRITEVAR